MNTYEHTNVSVAYYLVSSNGEVSIVFSTYRYKLFYGCYIGSVWLKMTLTLNISQDFEHNNEEKHNMAYRVSVYTHS